MRFTPVPRARQPEAVRFLLANAFSTPRFLVKPELLRRMEPAGAMTRVRNAQTSVMNSLLQPDRLDRLVEQARSTAPPPTRRCSSSATCAAASGRSWRRRSRPIDPFRRNTQRVYLDDDRQPAERGRRAAAGSARAAARRAARAARAGRRRDSGGDRPRVARCTSRTRAIRSTRSSIRARCGRLPVAARARGPSPACAFDFDNDPFLKPPDRCWPDYAI